MRGVGDDCYRGSHNQRLCAENVSPTAAVNIICFSSCEVRLPRDGTLFHTGRGPLQSFQQGSVDVDLRSGESEDYLCVLGVLSLATAAGHARECHPVRFSCAGVTEQSNFCFTER